MKPTDQAQLMLDGMPAPLVPEPVRRPAFPYEEGKEFDAGGEIAVIHCPIQLLERELNWYAMHGYYLFNAFQVYTLPGEAGAPPGVYVVAVCEFDEVRQGLGKRHA